MDEFLAQVVDGLDSAINEIENITRIGEIDRCKGILKRLFFKIE